MLLYRKASDLQVKRHTDLNVGTYPGMPMKRNIFSRSKSIPIDVAMAFVDVDRQDSTKASISCCRRARRISAQ